MNQSTDNFAELGLPQPILQALAELGYETPSPFQAACIPALLEGQDVLAETLTGSGKTAAFALPALTRVDCSTHAPQVLVLTPTRETALEIAEAFERYSRHLEGFHVQPLYAGQSIVVQLRQLARGPQVIIGTPGRVLDHIERESLPLDNIRTVILDDADEMLRLGFGDDLDGILEQLPQTRQTALFSATLPDTAQALARQHMREPNALQLADASVDVPDIRQIHWLLRDQDKLDALTRILEVEDDLDAALVFVRAGHSPEALATRLSARGYEVAALPAGLADEAQQTIQQRLEAGTLDVVIATDSGARARELARISHVIHYDLPCSPAVYGERVAHIGRQGRSGTAILFVAPREIRMLRAIERACGIGIDAIGLPSRDKVDERRVDQFKQHVIEVIEAQDLAYFHELVKEIEFEQEYSPADIAAALAWQVQRERPLRQSPSEEFGATAAPLNQGNRKKNPRSKEFRKEAPASRPQRTFSDGNLQRYRIEVGRNQGASPKEIVGAIANEGGIEGRYIGQIHIFADFSTVELPATLPRDVLDLLQNTRVRQCPLHIRSVQEGELPADGNGGSRNKGKGNKRSGKSTGNRNQQRPPRNNARKGNNGPKSQGGEEQPAAQAQDTAPAAVAVASGETAPSAPAADEAPAPQRKPRAPRTPRPRKKPATPQIEEAS